jgi:putative zinc finger protein
MSTICGYPGDRESALTAYVYDETTTEERAAFETHLASCPRCRTEVAAFAGVRRQLAHWSPPDFASIGRAAETPASERGGGAKTTWRTIPAWAQAAAAMLVLGAAAGIANLDIHYDAQSGLNIHTGWSRANVAPASPSPVAQGFSPANTAQPSGVAQGVTPANGADQATPWRADLAALEQQLRREMHAAPAADTDVLRRVRALVDESERRQQRDLALRVSALLQDLNARRQADLRKIDQNLGLIQDRTGVEVLRNRQMIDYFMQRVSQRP